jgi:hypothetical protein
MRMILKKPALLAAHSPPGDDGYSSHGGLKIMVEIFSIGE